MDVFDRENGHPKTLTVLGILDRISIRAVSASFISMAVNYLSPEGKQKLEQERVELKARSRELAKRVDEARAQGDLSENAEYHEAKDALGLCLGRMAEIDEVLKNVQIFEQETGTHDRVSIGTTVVVSVNGKEKTFAIVGSNEADPLQGKISNESPIGSALLGARVGESVSVQTPNGITDYSVIRIV